MSGKSPCQALEPSPSEAAFWMFSHPIPRIRCASSFLVMRLSRCREFSVKSQRSIGPRQKLSLPPMREFPIEPEQLRQWSDFAERTFPPERYGEFLGGQVIRAQNGEAFPSCEYLLPSVAPLSKSLLDFTPDFFVALDEPQDLNRWLESWTEKNERDFSNQHAMGIPASAPSTLFLRSEELGTLLHERRILVLDQLGTSALGVGF